MSDATVQPAAEPAPQSEPALSQWQRVACTFTAPSKTFKDIKAGHRSWWLPFVIYILLGYLFFGAVYTKIGMRQAVENQIHMNAKQEAQMANLPPDRRETSMRFATMFTEGIFLATPVFLLAGLAVLSLGLWGTINFGFGGKASFGGIFTAWMYAALPSVIKTLLGIVVIYAGVAPESFNLKNFAPTNIAAFLSPTDTNHALYTLLTSLDVITIWTLVLLGIGTAIVAGVKRSSGYIAVFGWWILFILIGVGWAAAFGG